MRLYQPNPPRLSSTSSFSSFERLLLIGAIILLFVGIGGYFWQKSRANSGSEVNRGGTYVEGVIDNSPTKIDRIISRVSNIGLTYRDSDDSIKPALAESWAITNDGKTYTFKIRTGYSADGLLATIQSTKTDWNTVKITAPDDSTLVFELTEPLTSFLSTTTAQLFPYGPYELVKRDKKDIIFRTNAQFPLTAAFIEKFEIRIYDNQDQLLKAAQNGEVDGSADFEKAPTSTWKEHTINLPRYYLLFFNTTRPVFKELEDRTRVINETAGSPVSYNLVTTQSTTASELADNLTRSLSVKGVTLNVKKENSATLQKEQLAKRDFDLLLYGIDYGPFRDYYPFWHSSQVNSPGLNVSGYKHKDLDKLLEQARKTSDQAEHTELNKKIEEHLASKGLQKVLSQDTSRFWVRSSIQDVKYGTIDEASDRFQLIWHWNIK